MKKYTLLEITLSGLIVELFMSLETWLLPGCMSPYCAVIGCSTWTMYEVVCSDDHPTISQLGLPTGSVPKFIWDDVGALPYPNFCSVFTLTLPQGALHYYRIAFCSRFPPPHRVLHILRPISRMCSWSTITSPTPDSELSTHQPGMISTKVSCHRSLLT